jgi:hypothetical protein
METEEREISLLEISYKSGYKFEMWFEEFEINGDSIKWKLAFPEQNILHLGIDNIVSIIQKMVITVDQDTSLSDI